HRQWLTELTDLPTAAGREQRVRAWVDQWVARREGLRTRTDEHGNLLIGRAGISGRRPIVFEAHMDHPGFVVASAGEPVIARFLGGVKDDYFPDATVRFYPQEGEPVVGRIQEPIDSDDWAKRFAISVDDPEALQTGDIGHFDVGPSRIVDGRLHAVACDNLASVAAALSAFDVLRRRNAAEGVDVRVFLTRAEEIGFIGSIGACRSKTLPANSRVIVLENSRAYAESPIGGGPIVRVGDATSTFDPELTWTLGEVARARADRDENFQWQRRLMPGGTCEASAYQAMGYTAACLCLPLGNYHNMSDEPGKVAAETIAVDDFHGLVDLLVDAAVALGGSQEAPDFRDRLGRLFEQRRGELNPESGG
ncbi:MAG: M20/M25/M40 family metallo-hydrolase, partial [Phycisphaeraceae bacterium]|nr:M20/M25/M40 family metallo-hydrolase [Phycisphaeraceae bacterium]